MRIHLIETGIVALTLGDRGVPDDRRCANGGDRVIGFEADVRIRRPIEQVFAFVSDPSLFPRWNSAVQTVERTCGDPGALGSTYSMRRELPSGQVKNELEVFALERPAEFGIRTTSGPTPFSYRYRFTSDGADTVVRLDAGVALPRLAAVLGPLAARQIRHGVEANFAALKRALEAKAGDDAAVGRA